MQLNKINLNPDSFRIIATNPPKWSKAHPIQSQASVDPSLPRSPTSLFVGLSSAKPSGKLNLSAAASPNSRQVRADLWNLNSAFYTLGSSFLSFLTLTETAWSVSWRVTPCWPGFMVIRTSLDCLCLQAASELSSLILPDCLMSFLLRRS